MNKSESTEKSYYRYQKDFLDKLIKNEKSSLINVIERMIIGKGKAVSRQCFYGIQDLFNEYDLNFDYLNCPEKRFGVKSKKTSIIPFEEWERILEWTKTYVCPSVGTRDYKAYCIFALIYGLRIKSNEFLELKFDDFISSGQGIKYIKGAKECNIAHDLYFMLCKYWESLPFDVGIGDSAFYLWPSSNQKGNELNYHQLWHTVKEVGKKAQEALGIDLGFYINPDVIYFTAQKHHKMKQT